MNIIFQMIIQIAIYIIMMALQSNKKPPTSKLEDLEVPEVSSTKSIAYGYGTFKQQSPNLTWYGNLSTKEITKKIMFSKITLGYNYYLTQMYTLGFGENQLLKIYMDDKEIWNNDENKIDSFNSEYKNDDFFAKDNGIHSFFDFYSGNQIITNSHLTEYNNLSIPPLKGLSYIVFKGNEVKETDFSRSIDNMQSFGSQSYVTLLKTKEIGAKLGQALAIKPYSFLMKRIPVIEEFDNQFAEIDGDYNPAFLIYDIITNEEYGVGLSKDFLDIDSFRIASEKLFNEGFGLSLIYEDKFSGKDFVNEICRHISANLLEDSKTGLIKLKLIRKDYNLENTFKFNTDNIVTLDKFSRTTNEDLYNEIKINYTNRDNNYKEGTGISRNTALKFERATSNQSLTMSFPFITNLRNANLVANREAVPVMSNLASVSLKTNRNYDLEAGDVFLLDWPNLEIENLVFRIQKINYGNLNSNIMTIDAIQDNFGVMYSIEEDINQSKFVDIDKNAKEAFGIIIETPRFFNNDYNSIMSFCFNTNSSNLNYNLKINEGLGYINSNESSFSDHIILEEPIDEFTNNIKISKDSFIELLTANAGEIEIGGNLLCILGSNGIDYEFISTTGIEIINEEYYLKNVVRGALDTIPKKFDTSNVIATVEDNISSGVELSVNEMIDIKIITKTDNGVLDDNEAQTINFTMSEQERYKRPILPANLKVNDKYIFNDVIIGLNEEISITWAFRNLINQNKVVDYYSDNESVNYDTVYNIKIFDSNNILIKEIDTVENSYIFDDELTLNPLLMYYNELNIEIESNRYEYKSLEKYKFKINRI